MLLNLEELKQPPFYHEMILVEGGTFMMGSDERDSYDFERPIHKVTVNAFLVAKYPVTQSLWKAIMGDNPSYFTGDSRPVEQVSWDDTQVFIQKIKEKTGIEFRLPTEAEWEYAARGGNRSKGFKYIGSEKLKEVAWHNENGHNETKSVGLKYPNSLNLYDMSGNVWEWCQDWNDDKYYEVCQIKGLVVDPQGPQEGLFRVIRGGSWFNVSEFCRTSYRDFWRPIERYNRVGFRLACSL